MPTADPKTSPKAPARKPTARKPTARKPTARKPTARKPTASRLRFARPRGSRTFDPRIAALRRFGLAITTLNVVGRAYLGIESSWAQMFACIGTAYALEGVLRAVEILAAGGGLSRPRLAQTVDYLLPSHIAAMATSMLLYANSRLAPVMFAVAAGIGSKHLFRISVNGRPRHFMNPSNFGIVVTLLLFPAVSMAPPYQFTTTLGGIADWVPMLLITCTGSLVNGRLTKRMPVVLSWVVGFQLQAVLRAMVTDTSLTAALAPMTGTAFILFSFYMITDPGTTPMKPRNQVAFGLTTAAVYGVMMGAHTPYALFFCLAMTCLLRGTGLVLFRLASTQPAWSRLELALPAWARS